jgi:hypothetical protein
MKAISAHVTGFYRSSFHAYTTEVQVEGHRWRLGLRYSKFHEFYDKLTVLEPEFDAPFPPKGTLFFTPKPEERQEQLEEFLQQVLAHYVAQSHPAEMGELLCELLKVPRHLKSLEREDDDVSTSTESVLDEPMHEPVTDSAAVEKVAQDDEVAKLAPVEPVKPEIPVVEEKEEKIVAAELEQPVSPAAEEAQEMEETPVALEQAEAEVGTPVPAEEAEVAMDAAKGDVIAAEKDDQEEETDPQVVTEQSRMEAVAEEEQVAAEAVAQAEGDVAETLSEVPEMESKEPGAGRIAQTETPQAAQPAAGESASPTELVEEESKELAATGLVPSWIAAYLPQSLLGFIRRRCLKKTNLVVLCVALLLPMVLARR